MTEFCNICDPKCKYSNCICNNSFTNFYDTYNFISNINKIGDIELVKKWSISTMTMCCSLNCDIDLEKYLSVYIHEVDPKKVKFYNCINTYIGTKYQNKNKVSIKIFKNGNIQIAGILNITSGTYTIRKIFKRIKNIEAFSTEKVPFVSNVRICMINSDFKINKSIKQSQLCKFFEESGDCEFIKRYTFNPSKYPGINVKAQINSEEKLVTCAIFRPGSIIITGGNNLDNYKILFEKFLFLLEKNKEILY